MRTRKLFRLIPTVLTVVLTLLLFAGTAVSADSRQEVFLADLSEVSTFSFTLWYDDGLPDAVLVSPSGAEYPIDENSNIMTAVVKDRYTSAKVVNAAAGTWSVVYDSSMTETFSSRVITDAFNISIDNLSTVYDEETAQLDIAFDITRTPAGSGMECYYSILLYISDDETTNWEIDDGYITSDSEHISVICNTSNLPDGESYKVAVEALAVDNGVTLYAYKGSNAISVSGADPLTEPTNVKVSLDKEQRIVSVDWNSCSEAWGADSFHVTVTDEANQTIAESDFLSNARKGNIVIPEGYDKITVSFAYRDNGLASVPYKYDIDFRTYSDASEGESSASDTVTNSTAAPSIEANNLSSGYNGITAGEFVVTGVASGAKSVTVNGSAAEMSADGSFSAVLNFEAGEHTVTIKAVGANSVESLRSYKLTVTAPADPAAQTQEQTDTTESKFPFWIPLAIGAAVAIAVIIFAVILTKKRATLKAFSFIPFIVLFSVTTAFSGAVLIIQLIEKSRLNSFNNSVEFVDLASRSVEEANQSLLEVANINDVIIPRWLYILIASAAALVLMIGAHILMKFIIKKRKSAPGKAKKPKKEKAAAEAAVPSPVEPAPVEPAPAEEATVTETDNAN